MTTYSESTDFLKTGNFSNITYQKYHQSKRQLHLATFQLNMELKTKWRISEKFAFSNCFILFFAHLIIEINLDHIVKKPKG